jgi:hypothetical protein
MDIFLAMRQSMCVYAFDFSFSNKKNNEKNGNEQFFKGHGLVDFRSVSLPHRVGEGSRGQDLHARIEFLDSLVVLACVGILRFSMHQHDKISNGCVQLRHSTFTPSASW